MTTFTWSPDYGASTKKAPRVRVAAFGDGYQQRVGDGINPIARSMSVQFNRTVAEIGAIDDFLSELRGTASFAWTPAYGYPGKWTCSEWSTSEIEFGTQSLSATFEEIFGD